MTQKETPSRASSNHRQSAKRDRSWSLLMVGDHGQIIPFRRVKGIAIALTTLATLAILAAVGLGLWGGWLRVQNAGLQTELKEVQQSFRRLKDEKDLLMAKVVIQESRTKKDAFTGKSTKAGQGTTATPLVAEASTAAEPPSPSKKTTVADKSAKAPGPVADPRQAQKSPAKKKTPPVTTASQAPERSTARVDVSAFMADHRPRNNALSARFQIKNTGARGQRVSGRCVLVLKNAVKSDMQWVSVPHVSLISGRPNGKQGRAFRIANFMTLKMQTERVPDNFAFETGTLYVYDDAGKQLLEKEVPVQLSYRKPPPKPIPAPKPAATETRVAPSPAPPAPAGQTPEPTGQTPEPTSQTLRPALSNAPSPGGPVPTEAVQPPGTAETVKPAPSVDPVAPLPNAVTPKPTPAPQETIEPAAPGNVGDDPSLMTGSEASPPTVPEDPPPEDTR